MGRELGRNAGDATVDLVAAFLVEHEVLGDWQKYMDGKGERLVRLRIAKALHLPSSVFSHNARAERHVKKMETALRKRGILTGEEPPDEELPVKGGEEERDARISSLEARVPVVLAALQGFQTMIADYEREMNEILSKSADKGG